MVEDAAGAPCRGSLIIDGESFGITPWKGPVIAKKHDIAVTCGWGTARKTVTIGHNEHQNLTLTVNNSRAIDWISIPSGSFFMGREGYDPSEAPVHKVNVSAFEMSKGEVTVAQYTKCVEDGVCTPPHWDDGKCSVLEGDDGMDTRGTLPMTLRRPDLPVVCVDWDQARTFAEWAGARLPTEAEWEYAARSLGTEDRYPWGSTPPTCENVVCLDVEDTSTMDPFNPAPSCRNNAAPMPPCSRPSGNSKQGVCDLAGNVVEWVEDGWHDSYARAPKDAKAWPCDCAYRVFRSCGWDWGYDFLDVRDRGLADMNDSHKSIGIRLAR